MNIDNIVDIIKKGYFVTIEKGKIDDGFVNQEILIRSSFNKDSLNFILGFGYNNELVIVNLIDSPFTFERLNNAEYGNDDLLKAVNDILEARLVVKQSLFKNKNRLCIITSHNERLYTNWINSKDFHLLKPYKKR